MLLLHIQRRRPSPPWWGDESALPIDQGPEEEPFWILPRPWPIAPPLLLFAQDEALPPVPDLDDKPPITMPRAWPLPWSPPLPFLWDPTEALPLAPPEEVPWTPLLTWPLAAPRSPPWLAMPLADADLPVPGTPPVFAHVGAFTAQEELEDRTTCAVTRTGVTAGNIVAVYVGWIGNLGPNAVTVHDGTSALTPATLGYSDTVGGQWFYTLASVATGDVTYTATFSGTVNSPCVYSFEVSCTGTPVLAADRVGTGDTNTTTPASAAMAISSPDAFVCGGMQTVASPLPTISNIAVAGLPADIENPATYGLTWVRIMTAPFTGAVGFTTDVPLGDWIVQGIAFALFAEPLPSDDELPALAPSPWAPAIPRLPFATDDTLPPLPGFLEDTVTSIPRPWALAPGVWATWGEDTTLPIGPELDDGEEWVAPLLQGIPPPGQPRWVPDELPLAPPEDAPWVVVFPPWLPTANVFPLFDVADTLALAPAEDVPWVPVFPRPVLSLAILAKTDDDVFPRVTFDEVDWPRPTPWADSRPGLPWLTDDSLPLVVLEESPWVAPTPWATLSVGLAWVGDDPLPIVSIEEEDQWVWLGPWLPQVPFPPWPVDDVLPIAALAFDVAAEWFWQPPMPWNEWRLPRAFSADDAPPPIIPPPVRDDVFWRRPVWWPEVPGRLGLWPDVDALPLAPPDADVWRAPLPWVLGLAPVLWPVDDALPPLAPAVEDAGWRPPSVWPGISRVLVPWVPEDGLPLAPPDDAASWAAPRVWPALPAVCFPWLAADELPRVASEAEGWALRLPWPFWTLGRFSFVSEDDTLPAAPLDTEESGWRLPQPWPMYSAMLPVWEHDETLPTLIVSEDDWVLPLMPWAPFVVGSLWDDADVYPTVPALEVTDDERLPPLPWPSWWQPQQFAQPDEVPAEFELPPVHAWLWEDVWLPPLPWDVPWPGHYQTHVPQDAPEALLVGVAWRTFDATCHDYTFTAPCHDFVFVGGGCVLQQFYKQPAENYLIAVDFSTAMPLGTTAVVSGTVSAMNMATGVDATATVLGSASAIVASPTVVHARVQAGDLTTYKLTFRVTFTPSAVLEEEIFMIVAET